MRRLSHRGEAQCGGDFCPAREPYEPRCVAGCRFVSFCTDRRTLLSIGYGFASYATVMEHKVRSILIVDDDPDIRRLVGDFLTREGFRVELAQDAREMAGILKRHEVDLIILDLMLPEEDGLSICRRLRATLTVPILMLTAKGDETDRVVGLELGADDYVVKPFGPRELLARVRALLRRASVQQAQAPMRLYAFDRFLADLDARQLFAEDEQLVPLTSAEFDLLSCFVLRPRRVLSRDQILDWVHGRTADPFDRSVDILVSRLRKKLDGLSPGCNLISTVRNGGYLMTAQVKQVS